MDRPVTEEAVLAEQLTVVGGHDHPGVHGSSVRARACVRVRLDAAQLRVTGAVKVPRQSREAYDLARGPLEQRFVAAAMSHPEKLATLRAALGQPAMTACRSQRCRRGAGEHRSEQEMREHVERMTLLGYM